MRKSLNSTLILAVVFILLTLWYTVYEKKVRVEQTTQEEKSKRLITLESDQIQEIEIQRKKDEKSNTYEKIKLKKSGSDWTLLEPVQETADTGTVSSALGTLVATKEERTVDEKPKDLETYGLKNPAARVLVRKDSTTPAEEILIGGNTPVGFSSYAKLANKDAVFKTARSLKTTFEKDLFSYRNKQVSGLNRLDISEIELQVGKENTVLKKGPKDTWILARENMPADANEVNKSAGALADMRATAIPTEIVPGFKTPLIQITAIKKDGTKVGIKITKAKDKYFAKRDDRDTVYEIPKTSVEPLERSAAAYRNMNLAIFNRYDVKHIKMERGDSSFDLVKNETGWAFPNEPAVKVDTAQVDSLLTKLQDTKIAKFQNRNEDPHLKQPKLVLHLYDKGDKAEVETATLSFSAPDKKDVFVKRMGLDPVFTIREDDFVKFFAPKQSYIQQEAKPEDKKRG